MWHFTFTMHRLKRALSLLRPTLFRRGVPYTRDDLRADVVAGVTVAVMQVPQSMALASIVGLPAVYGLYASLPGFIANIWGSSRQLSTGPVAITSFLTLAALVPLANPGSPDYIRLAAALALLSGIMYLVFGLFRLGLLFSLVPSPVVVGFSTAAATIIVVSQISNLTGIPGSQHAYVLQSIRDIVLGFPQISLMTCMVGALGILLLFYGRRLPKIFPASLVVLIIGIAAGFGFALDAHNVALVGAVPSNLPTFLWPHISLDEFLELLPKAAVIALVSYVGAYASAKIVARRTHEHLDTNQELVGQGLANVAAGLFQGFPLGGSFTRTAINIEAGARTGVAAIVTACITLAALFFFAPLFYYLPKAILAAIVIVSAIPLINLSYLRELYHRSKTDGSIAYLTAGVAFILKPDDAIFIGVVVALTLFIRRTAWGARVIELGIDERWHVLREYWHADDALANISGAVIVRVDQSLFYANAQHITRLIDVHIAAHEAKTQSPAHTLILDTSAIGSIDTTAMEVLEEYVRTLHERDIRLGMMYVRQPVVHALHYSPQLRDVTILHNIVEMRVFISNRHGAKHSTGAKGAKIVA